MNEPYFWGFLGLMIGMACLLSWVVVSWRPVEPQWLDVTMVCGARFRGTGYGAEWAGELLRQHRAICPRCR